MTYRWEIVPESTENKAGGDYEAGIASIKGLVVEEKEGKLIFKAPKKEGGYRLFIYAYDGNNNVATGNIPFYVK